MDNNLLKEILEELKNIHHHLDNLEIFYMYVNRVEMKKEEVKKEDKK